MNDSKVKGNKKDTVIKADNKVCAILNSITSVIWAFVTFMEIYEIKTYGTKPGWNLWFDICMVILWGSIALDYFCKYKKEKKEQ